MGKKKHNLALITGASSGLGAAIAMELAKTGVDLLLTGRSQSKLSTLASYLRPSANVTFFPCDLTNRNDRKKLLFEVHEHAPDLVINNAGCGLYGPALSYTTDEQIQTHEVNTTALMEITLECARILYTREKKGTILNVSSIASFFTFPYLAIYSASKDFVVKFSKNLDTETKSHNIRILVSCPGQIDTEFSKRASKGYLKKSDSAAMTKEYAAKRILQQIQSEKGVDLFDFRFKCAVYLTKFIPDWIKLPFFKRSMEKRFLHKEWIKTAPSQHEKMPL